ncbi:hypothetical protein L1887_54889 [Cichorium endivia]|nr:hypothetical protein L1887_54889 [Cichorium endivia]
MKGPFPVISRGSVSNYTSFTSDARAAWQNALMWYITGDDAHRNVSTSILDGWGSNLTDIIGTDRSLLLGTEGLLFVNAAEIMRWEGNWTEQGATYKGGTGFSVQLYWLFARQSVIVGQANYGMASIHALLNYAIYLEDVSMYNYALDMLQNDPCAGLEANFDLKTGQGSESGRDQVYDLVYYEYIQRLRVDSEAIKEVVLRTPAQGRKVLDWTENEDGGRTSIKTVHRQVSESAGVETFQGRTEAESLRGPVRLKMVQRPRHPDVVAYAGTLQPCAGRHAGNPQRGRSVNSRSPALAAHVAFCS